MKKPTNAADITLALRLALTAQTNEQSQIEALTLALRLALTATTDEQSQMAVKLANQLSSRLTKEHVDAVKAELEKEMADD